MNYIMQKSSALDQVWDNFSFIQQIVNAHVHRQCAGCHEGGQNEDTIFDLDASRQGRASAGQGQNAMEHKGEGD